MSKTIVITILAFALLGVSSVQAGMGTKVTLRYDPFEVRGMARPGIPTVILGQAADGADTGAVRALLHVPSWLGSTTFVDAGPSTSVTVLSSFSIPAIRSRPSGMFAVKSEG